MIINNNDSDGDDDNNIDNNYTTKPKLLKSKILEKVYVSTPLIEN